MVTVTPRKPGHDLGGTAWPSCGGVVVVVVVTMTIRNGYGDTPETGAQSGGNGEVLLWGYGGDDAP